MLLKYTIENSKPLTQSTSYFKPEEKNLLPLNSGNARNLITASLNIDTNTFPWTVSEFVSQTNVHNRKSETDTFLHSQQ